MKIKQYLKENPLVLSSRMILNYQKYKPLNCFIPGHFYSPIVSKNDLIEFEQDIWGEQKKEQIAGIELSMEAQLSLLKEFSNYYPEIPFKAHKENRHRYHFENRSYSYTDGIILYSFMRHFKPKRIIEIGSGFSSTLMLDTKDLFSMNIDLTFIEPYPELLYSLLSEHDKTSARIIPNKVQSVDVSLFKSLEENDILFIDSSHISKTGSDLNYELFKILPALNPGVLIHFHDIFYPFEYPKELVYEGRNWNENYLLRAFLSYNKEFKIKLFSHYLHLHHKEAFADMPLTYKNCGANLWLQKR